jgi:serine/threonine protein kinase
LLHAALSIAGSISHLAPEVLHHGRFSKAADVYSFGVLIFLVGLGRRFVMLHYNNCMA